MSTAGRETFKPREAEVYVSLKLLYISQLNGNESNIVFRLTSRLYNRGIFSRSTERHLRDSFLAWKAIYRAASGHRYADRIHRHRLRLHSTTNTLTTRCPRIPSALKSPVSLPSHIFTAHLPSNQTVHLRPSFIVSSFQELQGSRGCSAAEMSTQIL